MEVFYIKKGRSLKMTQLNKPIQLLIIAFHLILETATGSYSL